ncbi:hypothetical protein [Massilia scottii]|uniref:hypothetical protein n=1 Tax=Massilia scottii TaxID=3057166 RepID=UPI002796CED4|nr:hypothetical protein [Massilia sp. CCM 9029]MDQ1833307.1 hypothetical protein [Massilia sp. CCM 9029]
MQTKIQCVDDVLGFMFEKGFARKFDELGSPPADLEFWYINALVYATVAATRPPLETRRIALLSLIEAIHFQAKAWIPIYGDAPCEFDVSGYQFPEDILVYESAVIDGVVRQRARASSAG